MNKKILILLLVLVAVTVFTLTGCKEDTKQDAVPYTESDAVYSNGGMAVVYGNYLFYANGFADVAADNTFGTVVKGAIMRVELDENKLPKKDTVVTVVPKKVYYSNTTNPGIYINGGYIYYATTSIEKNSEGEPKTDMMVIMRTKLDGTGTQTVKEFDAHGISFMIGGNNLYYVSAEEYKLIRIDLNSKKFEETTIEEKINTSYYFTGGDTNYLEKGTQYLGAKECLVYSVANDDGTTTFKAIYADGGDAVTLMTNDSLGEKFGDKNVTYTVSVLKAKLYNGELKVLCSITDNGVNTPSLGIYMCSTKNGTTTISAVTKNSSSAEGLAYSDFYFFKGKILLVGTKQVASTSVTKFDLLNADLTSNTVGFAVFGSAITVIGMENRNNTITCYYTADSKTMKIDILKLDGDTVTVLNENAVNCYASTFATSGWAASEIIYGTFYFMNSSVSNNIYYLELGKIVDRDSTTCTPVRLGTLTDADRIAAF